jgi:hypothetical protein
MKQKKPKQKKPKLKFPPPEFMRFLVHEVRKAIREQQATNKTQK